MSWLNKRDVSLIFKNIEKRKKEITISYFDRTSREEFENKLSMEAGEVDTVSFKLFRPQLITVTYNDDRKQFYLIPNKDVEVELSNSVDFVGYNRVIYSVLYKIGDHELDEAESNGIIRNESLPGWLGDYLVKARAFKKYYKIYHTAGYQQFTGMEVSIPSKTIRLKM